MRTYAGILIAVVATIAVVAFFVGQKASVPPTEHNSQQTTPNLDRSATAPTAVSTPGLSSQVLAEPVSSALSRITKKPFGIYVTPKNSPVQPERFTGYHTGVDFETTPEEQKSDVSVSAVCDGKLLLKKWASGYGGVAVQACVINNQDVTIVYGHVRLSSISVSVGDTLSKGKVFATLGTGYSTETDGERKHLHLAIHKGTSIVLLGYVQKESDLSVFLDAEPLLK